MSVPGTNLPILNVRFDGEYRGYSGQHMLNASSSHFDPKRSFGRITGLANWPKIWRRPEREVSQTAR
jgi:hypothetical protein